MKTSTLGYGVRLKTALETEAVEYARGVLGDRLDIVTAGDQTSNDEPELDCLTLPKVSDINQV